MSTLLLAWLSLRTFLAPTAIVLVAVIAGVVFERFGRARIVASPFVQRRRWLVLALDALDVGVVLWFAILGIYVAVSISPLSATFMKLCDQLLLTLGLVSMTLVAARFAGGVVTSYGHRGEHKLVSASLFSSITQGAVFVMGALVLLSSLGIEITPLLTALGVGGLAVALALKDPLANLFSGLQLAASRQIRPGDFVRLETGFEGFVEDINWRNITIRELPNNLIVVPNEKLAQAIFINYRLPEPKVASRVALRAAYGSDLNFVEELATQAARIALDDIGARGDTGDPHVRFHTFGDTTLEFTVHFQVPQMIDQARAQSAVVRRFYELLRQNGIDSPISTPVVAPARAASSTR